MTNNYDLSKLPEMDREDIKIRMAHLNDMDPLERLEYMAWDPKLVARREEIQKRYRANREGLYVAESAEGIQGALYTQKIRSVADLRRTSFKDQHLLHDPEGPIVQLLSINVNPETIVHGNIADLLREHAIADAKRQGAHDVVAMTRCS